MNTQTHESALTYIPPAETPAEEIQDFNDSLTSAISEIGDEFNQSEYGETTDQELETTTASTPEPEQEPEQAVEKESEAGEDPAIARGMERLVAREVALQARETAFQAKEHEFAAAKAELAQLKAAAPPADLMAQFEYSPSDAIKHLGYDPEHVVRLMVAEQLKAKGQEVPEVLQRALEKAESRRELAQLKAQLKAQSVASETSAYINSVVSGAHEWVALLNEADPKKNVGKAMPTLAKIAKTNPAKVHRDIMEEIFKDARQRAGADPNGQHLAYEEAAKRVEARLAEYKLLLDSPTNDSPIKQASGAKTAFTPPQPKPPARPLKPWEKRGDSVLDDAIKDAEREFHRVEMANRKKI